MRPLIASLSSFVLLSLVTASTLAAPAASTSQAPAPTSDPLASGTVQNGTKWFRKSAEYRILALEAFRSATRRLEAIAETRYDRNWVVVSDADETLIDNSLYNQVNDQLGVGFDPKTWDEWVVKQQAGAIPGAFDFVRAVVDAGGKLAIVTNRERAREPETWANLVALGMPDDRSAICLLGIDAALDKKTNTEEWAKYGYANDKDRRRRLLREGIAQQCWKDHGWAARHAWNRPLDIVLEVGDNVQDFAGVTQAGAVPEQLLRKIGRRLILLPNPMYGSWEK
ncbi:MAG: HAD family acid phosphatase [Pseudomonas sp.]|uniref:HAD family acid phosphatase n=1 Tax=Pseudomonas sp. TaxID=306 RepID=UPI003393908B